jgi:pilus assembly protein CpaB
MTVSAFVPRTPPPQQAAVIPEAAPVREPNTKTVIVAARPLQFGMVLAPDMLVEVQWPVASVPAGAFSSRDALLGPGRERTVQADIAKNEPILPSKITGPGQRGSLAAVIGEGMMAVTVRVDEVLGVAGFVQPGNRVDVILTRNERAATASGKPATSVAYSDVLLQNVRVLAIDQQAIERAGQPKPAKAVTIEVTPEGAAKVSLGMEIGRLSLALLPAGSAPGTGYRRIEVEDLGKRKPGLMPPSEKTESGSTVVTVTRGTDRSVVEITESGRREIKLSSKTVTQPLTPQGE